MAWVKIPKEHHPLFHAALPDDPRVETRQMFGGVCAMVNGHMFGGLFAESAMVRLGGKDLDELLALEGAEPFDPMGRGKPMADMVMLPKREFEDPKRLRAWLGRAMKYTATLPPKTAKKKKSAKKK